jgi:hypothetical protein
MPEIKVSGVDIQQLAATSIFAGPGQPLLVGQLWQKQTVILVFLRHFACIACRAHAAQVWGEREKYQSGGARIIFIGNGLASWIERFRQDLGIEHGVVLTDPSLLSFEAAGMRLGYFDLLRPQSVINRIKLAKDGYSATPYSKDAGVHWQMGGILAVNKQGKALFHFASKALGDFPDEPYRDLINEDEKAILLA